MSTSPLSKSSSPSPAEETASSPAANSEAAALSSETTNKRKQSSSSSEEEEEEQQSNKRQQLDKSETPAVSGPPPLVALPPPLIQYPNGQFIPFVHPHHQQAAFYYHPQQPIYYPVSPQQHPFNTTSPVLLPQQQSETSKKTTPRILPKTPDHHSSPTLYPQSPYFHPYVSPTLVPYTDASSRQNSISSSPGLGPLSTADQREKARKVSHSAIERRRRERINDKIFQLKQLIPSCVNQDNLHKMSILQSAIDYISYLKDIVTKLENNEHTGESLLKGDHLKVKTAKSMLPKEVEPFTTQFSVKEVKSIKPMDVIQSGAPLTPPPSEKHMSLQNILC